MRWIALIGLAMLGAAATAQTLPPQAVIEAPEPAVVARPFTYALIVGGINLDPEEQQRKGRAILQLQRLLVDDLRTPADHVTVLADAESFVRGDAQASTAKTLHDALADMARRVGPTDTFLFYYVGQANTVEETLRLNLRGPDVVQTDLLAWLTQVKPRMMVAVLDCPGAGLLAEPLAAPNRILIFGARSDQPYATRLSDFLVPAMHAMQSDTNHDGAVTLLEAFHIASLKVEEAYAQASQKKTETALMDDNGDGVPTQHPWAFMSDQEDGSRAARFVLYGAASPVERVSEHHAQ